jgi:hypothetical protein
MARIDPNTFEDITIPDMPIMSPMAFAYPPASQGTDSTQLIMALISARHAERAETAPQNVQQEDQPDPSGELIGGVAAGLAASEAPSFSETPATDTPAAASPEPEQPKTPPEPQAKPQPDAPAPQPPPEPAPAPPAIPETPG